MAKGARRATGVCARRGASCALHGAYIAGAPMVFAQSIPYPHPVITEVLFNVPGGDDGDANKDGVRSATGDEFIEIMNPHDRPIELGGYTLSDRNPETSRRLFFTFPACRLEPGQIAVVFNGHESNIPGTIGDESARPRAGNPEFGGALVFTMRIESSQRALGNSGDFVLLAAPAPAGAKAGRPIDAVVWGESDPAPPEETLRIAIVPASVKGSVHRADPAGEMTAHAKSGAGPFSPGVVQRRGS